MKALSGKLYSFFLDKYKKLSSLDVDKDSINKIFYNRLIKHVSNENKGILIFSGRWNNFASFSLAQTLAPSTKLSIYILNFVHPLSDSYNVCELNPMFSGSLKVIFLIIISFPLLFV